VVIKTLLEANLVRMLLKIGSFLDLSMIGIMVAAKFVIRLVHCQKLI
jgi:hypothetical protein